MDYPEPPKRGTFPVRILMWIIAGIILGIVVCCGGLFLGAVVSPSLYR